MPEGLRVALARTALVVTTLLAMLLFGVSWWVAGQLTADVGRAPDFDRGQSFEATNRVVAIEGAEVTLRADATTSVPGSRWGLWSERGYMRMTQQLALDEDAGTARWLLRGQGSRLPSIGLPVRVDPYFVVGDPQVARGLAFEEIVVDGPLGDQPTWLVPTPDDRVGTVVFVHAPGARPDQVNRYLPALVASGWDVLVPTHRGGPGAPPVPGGRALLGTAAWEDVEPVLELASDEEPLVLFGLSGGADIVMQLLDRSPAADRVTAAVLDSPTLSLDDRLTDELAELGVPSAARPLVSAGAQWIADVVHGLDGDALEQVADDATVARPTLVVVGERDERTDPALAAQLAQQAPSVQLATFPDAGHAVAWNTDPPGYVRVLRDFLAAVVR